MTPRETLMREQHHRNGKRRVDCGICFLLAQLDEQRELVRALEARLAPGWEPVLDIGGCSPPDEGEGS